MWVKYYWISKLEPFIIDNAQQAFTIDSESSLSVMILQMVIVVVGCFEMKWFIANRITLSCDTTSSIFGINQFYQEGDSTIVQDFITAFKWITCNADQSPHTYISGSGDAIKFIKWGIPPVSTTDSFVLMCLRKLQPNPCNQSFGKSDKVRNWINWEATPASMISWCDGAYPSGWQPNDHQIYGYQTIIKCTGGTLLDANIMRSWCVALTWIL